MIKYPAQIDDSTSLPLIVSGGNFSSDTINDLRNAIVAVETELGIKPKGANTTVKARLDLMDAAIGGLQNITLANDLGGTLSLPKVVGLQGIPLSSVPPTSGQAIVFNGLIWAPATVSGGSSFTAGGDLSGSSSSQSVVGIRGYSVLSTVPTSGQALTFNGSAWAPASIPGSFTAGGDLSGSSSSQNVIRLQGRAMAATAPSSGQAIIWDGSAWSPTTLSGSFSAGGDLSGSSSSQTVIKLQGRSLVATAPTNGQAIIWGGSEWAPTTLPLTEIIYQQGGTTASPVFATWAEVQAVIAATSSHLTVYIDDSVIGNGNACVPDGSGVTDCKSLVTIKAYNKTLTRFTIGTIGGVNYAARPSLLDLFALDQIDIETEYASGGELTFSYYNNISVLYMLNGCCMTHYTEGSYLTVPTSKKLELIINNKLNDASAITTIIGNIPFTVASGGELDITSYGKSNIDTTGSLYGGSGVVNVNYDTSLITDPNGFLPGLNWVNIGNQLCIPTTINTSPIFPLTVINYTAHPGELINVDLDSVGANVNIQLPALSTINFGTQIIVKATSISTTFVISVNIAGEDTIEGYSSDTIRPTNYLNGKIYVATALGWSIVANDTSGIEIRKYEEYFLAGKAISTSTIFEMIGSRYFDISNYPATIGRLNRTIRFIADISATSPATASIQLIDATTSTVISGSEFSTSSAAIIEFNGLLSITASAQLEAQLRMTGAGGDAVCTSARLLISYA